MKATVAMLVSGLAVAAPTLAATPYLTPECEEALALSALPERLRGDATTYTLTNHGFERSRAGHGPFTCIVERNHPLALIPQCVDAAGAETIIPALIFKSERALAGRSPEEVAAEFEQKARDGEFQAPARPGISYMTSPYNYIYLGTQRGIAQVDPHLMFYAPGLTNADVGGSFAAGTEENRGLPFVLEPGIHGYMISFVDHASDGQAVRRACDGQVGETPPTLAGTPSIPARVGPAAAAGGHEH
jgi:hypothetical protein